MRFFNRLELKFGKYAIRNLMIYMTAIYAAGLVIQLVMPDVYTEYLSLNVPKILSGEIWRLATWLMYPPSTGPLLGALLLYIYYTFGAMLERAWGAFKFNIFIFSGIIFHILAAFIIHRIYGIYGVIWLLTPQKLNFSILLAMLTTFSEATFLLFFIIPVKAKWLGIFYGVMTLFDIIKGPMAYRIETVLALLNFIIFYLVTGKARMVIDNVKQKIRKNNRF